MLTKPNIQDSAIIKCLADAYGLDATAIDFLPLGADFNTAVYRVTTTHQIDYFLKLKSGEFTEASVAVPKYLADRGIKQIIPPLSTTTGELWGNLGAFKAILYPYIEGSNGVDTKLSEDQWIQLGATLKMLHEINISPSIIKNVPKEAFSPQGRKTVKTFLARIENELFEEPIALEMAKFLSSKRLEIHTIIEKTEALATILQQQPLNPVLCHADLHGWNLMIDEASALYVIDWDTLILAPKERDLMFIGAGIWDSGRTPTEEELLFYRGYGQADINPNAIAYYRFERILQDIAAYCEYIFLSDQGGDDRAQCFEYLKANFLPGRTIERAYQADFSALRPASRIS